MKAREARQSVMLPVRIRQETKWSDACIRNVSSRGLLLQMDAPPPKGSYIEIRRGDIVIVGQVRWLGEDCCGLRTQDKVPIDYLKTNRPGTTAARSREAFVDRRASVRVLTPEEVAERSRVKSAWFQKILFVGAGAAGAIFLATLVYDALQLPMAAIANSLK